jgi:hypothetical protein
MMIPWTGPPIIALFAKPGRQCQAIAVEIPDLDVDPGGAGAFPTKAALRRLRSISVIERRGAIGQNLGKIFVYLETSVGAVQDRVQNRA